MTYGNLAQADNSWCKPLEISQGTEEICTGVQGPRIRIALLTPYTGGNLGDAAIQDSMIANLRGRLPCAQFTGITLNCENFIKKHGVFAFPLLASSMPLGREAGGRSEARPIQFERSKVSSEGLDWNGLKNQIKRAARSLPGSAPIVRGVRAGTAGAIRSLSHSFEAYRVLRKQDLFIVSGGGQLDDEWGGAWELPFALVKWILLARLAGVPCAMASVGAGKISSFASRLLFSTALRLSSYRSYRETNTRTIAAGLMSRAEDDPVVADLVFSLPEFELPAPTGTVRSAARGRTIIAVSPIAFAKPLNWPTPDRAVHERYVQEMAKVLSCLSRDGYFPIVVCSSLGDDESVIPEILEHLDEETRQSLSERTHFPDVKTWREFAAVLREADYLIASRLHGTILGFLTQTPTVAISFDPKVDWVMEDLDQVDYLLQIRDFTAEQVLQKLDRLRVRRLGVIDRLISYRRSILSPAAAQYDALSKLALAHQQSHS